MSWSSHDRRMVARACLPIALAMTMPATAQTRPRLAFDLSQLLSDNPLLIPGTRRSAALIEATVRPGVTHTTSTGSTYDLAAILTSRSYSRRYGNIVIGRIDASTTQRDSEFLSFGGSVSFARDSAIDLLTSSVEAAADPTGIRNTAAGRVFVAYRPDAYTVILPEVRVERSTFARSELLGDTRAITTAIAYRRRFSTRRTLGLRVDWIASKASRQTGFDTFGLYGTIDQQLSAGWRIDAELGIARNGARTDLLGATPIRQPARMLLGGRFNLCRTAPEPAICASASLSSEVSGLAGLQRRAVAGVTVNQRLNETTVLRATAEYQRTHTQERLFPAFDAIRAVTTVERSLGRRIVVAGIVQYLRRRLIDGDRVGTVYGGLRLTFTPGIR